MPAPHDRRAKLVQLTDSGKEVVSVALRLVPQLEARVVDALGRSRWLELRDDLATIRTLFERDG